LYFLIFLLSHFSNAQFHVAIQGSRQIRFAIIINKYWLLEKMRNERTSSLTVCGVCVSLLSLMSTK